MITRFYVDVIIIIIYWFYIVISNQMSDQMEVNAFCLGMTPYYFADNAKAEYINFQIRVKGQVWAQDFYVDK